jgi:hypothetical protein
VSSSPWADHASPACIRRSRSRRSVASSRSLTSRSSLKLNSRPIVAASCAVALDAPRRSIRDVNEASIVTGISAATGPTVSQDTAFSRSAPESRIDRVSSSTNRGTPSQRSTMCRSTSLGSALPSATLRAIDSTSARWNRESSIMRSAGAAAQSASSSDRAVKIPSSGTSGAVLTSSSRNSRVEVSAQCRSSTNSSAGPG